MQALDALAIFSLRRPRAVFATWLASAAVGAFFAPGIFDTLTFQFYPVPGTPSHEAQQRILTDFPSLADLDTEFVLISCDEPCSKGVASVPFAAVAVRELRQWCAAARRRWPGVLQNWTDQLEYVESAAARMRRGVSPLMSPSNQTMLFKVSWRVTHDQQSVVSNTLLHDLQSLVDGLDRRGHESPVEAVSVALTGRLALLKATLQSTEDDMSHKHIFVLPVALLVFLFRLQSWRLCLLPALCFAISVTISLGVFVPISKYAMTCGPFTPPAMLFIIMALSIDYSLFLLTRFCEEVTCGQSLDMAIRAALQQSGHIVLVSGSVLGICYGGLVFFPGGGIPAVGAGCAMSIALCMATNLTITPSVIVLFPGFFKPASPAPGANLSGQNGCWPAFAAALTKPPWLLAIPVLCLAMQLPLVIEGFQYRISFANSLSFPRHGPAVEAHRILMRDFSPGDSEPQFVLQSLPPAGTAADRDALMDRHFRDLCALSKRMLMRLGPEFNLQPKDMQGLAFAPDPADARQLQCIPWDLAQLALEDGGDVGTAAREMWQRLMSPANRSSVIVLSPPFDPYSEQAQSFVLAARGTLSASAAGAVRADAVLVSASAVIADIVDASYRRFPWILVTTISIAFVVIAIAFRAALAPVKMLLTVVYPLAAVFGLTVWIYQARGLQWLGVSALQSPVNAGLYWAVPLLSCTVLVGMALDYDIFLFARVVEFRLRGFDNTCAVRSAVCLTGPIITSAGMIMAIALGGMLLCSVPFDNQFGFIMSFGVLVDTFVIRTCLVPSILTLAEELNYWPRALPPVTKSAAECHKLGRESIPGVGSLRKD